MYFLSPITRFIDVIETQDTATYTITCTTMYTVPSIMHDTERVQSMCTIYVFEKQYISIYDHTVKNGGLCSKCVCTFKQNKRIHCCSKLTCLG